VGRARIAKVRNRFIDLFASKKYYRLHCESGSSLSSFILVVTGPKLAYLYLRSMRRLLIAATAVIIAAPGNCSEKTKVFKECLKAVDYKGCVEVMEGKTSKDASKVDSLRNALKLLPSRLENTNRRDFYANIQPFSDALGVLSAGELMSDYEKYLYSQGQLVKRMLDIIAETWSDQISLRIQYKSYYEPVCENAQKNISRFNAVHGMPGVTYKAWTEKVLWQTTNGCYDPTAEMILTLIKRIEVISEDPEKKKQRLASEARELELQRMAPWIRHLEENPGLKKWAEKNPAAAKVVRSKWEEVESKKSQNSDKSQNSRWSELIWGAQ